MPPKKANEPPKKKATVDDKTFGMKNKKGRMATYLRPHSNDVSTHVIPKPLTAHCLLIPISTFIKVETERPVQPAMNAEGRV